MTISFVPISASVFTVWADMVSSERTLFNPPSSVSQVVVLETISILVPRRFITIRDSACVRIRDGDSGSRPVTSCS